MKRVINKIFDISAYRHWTQNIFSLRRPATATPFFFLRCAQCGMNAPVLSYEDLKKTIALSGNRYFLMRHGESMSNIYGINNSVVNGRYPLTDAGRKDARLGAEKVLEIRPDLIFSSPLPRARETAEIVAERVNIAKEDIIIDARLRVPYFGVFEGRTVAEYNAHFSSLEQKIFEAPQGGESMLDCRKYVTEFLYEIEKRYASKKILIISHSGTLWMLSAGACGAGIRETVALRGETNRKFLAKGDIKELPFIPIPHNKNFEFSLENPYIKSAIFMCRCGGEIRCVTV